MTARAAWSNIEQQLLPGVCPSRTLSLQGRERYPREAIMALRFLGKDPGSDHGQSPSVWEDGDTYVVQGWRIEDAATLAGVGDIPSHETLVRIPKRLMSVFPEVNGDGASGGAKAG
jgi:hypothetical protein